MHRWMYGLMTALAATSVAVPASARQGAADAWLDDGARQLVEQARARRGLVDRRIEAYRTTASERVSVGLDARVAEKLLYRRETVTRIDWRRDGPVNLEVLAAREVVPAFVGHPSVPAGLSGSVPALAFDPVDSEMLLRLDSTVVRHPLAAGSEAHYRFGTGDSTVVTLPDGRRVRLRELRIQPRRRDRELINGSFWLDMETHAVVQAYFRLAARSEDRVALIGATTAELDYVAIDYGLWDLRWWLPRTVAARGVFTAGRFRVPISYERRYSGYEIVGDTVALAPRPGDADLPESRPCRPRYTNTVNVTSEELSADSLDARFARAWERERARQDSVRAARADSARVRLERGDTARARAACDREFNVTTLRASELLHSELLPPSIYTADAGLISPEELRTIEERVRAIAPPPWILGVPRIALPLRRLELVRYNRVEGFAPSVQAALDLGFAHLDAGVRFGTADRQLRGELAVTRRGDVLATGIGVYRRLDVLDVAVRPFTLGSSLAALLVGRDDNDYFDARGAELRVAPAVARSQRWDLRLFAERQRPVEPRTDFSLLGLLDDDRSFRGNIIADSADQAGAVLRLRGGFGLDPRALRAGAELRLHGETGDFTFVRPSLYAEASLPLTRRWSASVEAGAGTGFGDLPLQRHWQLGGAPTLRGYPAGAVRGDSFWRARAELGLGFPFARVAVFGDAGWAGPQDAFAQGRPLRSAGVGLNLLDGLFRIDVARGLDAGGRWGLHVGGTLGF